MERHRDLTMSTALRVARVIDAVVLTFTSGGEHPAMKISAPDGFKQSTEKVTELGASTFTRIGLTLLKPFTEATVEMLFRP